MACRCNERRASMTAGAKALARGQIAPAVRAAGYVSRTLAEDARSGALQQAATTRLAQMRARIGRR